jgi:predicted phosphodiesterase
MKIVCISDTHEKHKQLNLPKGDVLIHAGDFT